MPTRVVRCAEPLPGGIPVLVTRDLDDDLTVIAVNPTRTPWGPENYDALNALLRQAERPRGCRLNVAS